MNKLRVFNITSFYFSLYNKYRKEKQNMKYLLVTKNKKEEGGES